MQKLAYTRFDRDMELALFRLQQFHQIKATDGLEVACQVVQPGDPEATFPHDIPVEHLPIYESLNVLEHYAYEEKWDDKLGTHLGNLQMFIQSVAHPDLVEAWQLEAKNDQSVYLEDEDEGETHYQAFGNHYKGILEDITQRAKARHDLDEGVHLTLDQIAYLSELNERTVMNAVQYKGANCLETDGKDENGRLLVDPVTALEWLSTKEKFKPTHRTDGKAQVKTQQPETIDGDWVFVPEARDGSRFLPGLRTKNGYTIGKKGSERLVEEYFDALNQLVHMEVPCWRRKNAVGNSGLVSGVHWVKVPSQEIQN